MNWIETDTNWSAWCARVRDRFPRLDPAIMERRRKDRRAFEAYLADVHKLSLIEAREEIDDLLYIESLSRELVPAKGQRHPA